MIKLLIVDDHSIIRKSLHSRIKWEDEGIEVIGEASNGREALGILKENSCHIIITDIKMPDMDGLELIKICKSKYPHIQFIIISSFDDFQYTKQAIQYEVVNYILKPINNMELVDALGKCKERIRRLRIRRKQRSVLISRKALDQFARQNSDLLCLLNTRSSQGISHMDQQLLAKYNYNLDHKRMIMLACNLPQTSLQKEDIYTLYKKLPAIENMKVTPLLLHKHVFLLWLTCNDEERVYEHIDTFIDTVLSQIDDPIYFAISIHDNQLIKIRSCLAESINALYYRFLREEEQVSYYTYDSQISPKSLLEKELDDLRLALGKGSFKAIESCIDEIFMQIKAHDFTASALQFILNRIINSIHSIVLALGIDDQFLHKAIHDGYYYLRFNTLMDIKKRLLDLTASLCEESTPSTGAYDDVLLFIQSSYTDAITLNSLSDQFHLNANYLGQYIKKQTGKTFNQYINELRIQRAKEIMTNEPEIKLQQLSHDMGYADSHYFSRVFRKLTGLSPTEYKKSDSIVNL